MPKRGRNCKGMQLFAMENKAGKSDWQSTHTVCIQIPDMSAQ